jgi:hypothetical protein
MPLNGLKTVARRALEACNGPAAVRSAAKNEARAQRLWGQKEEEATVPLDGQSPAKVNLDESAQSVASVDNLWPFF